MISSLTSSRVRDGRVWSRSSTGTKREPSVERWIAVTLRLMVDSTTLRSPLSHTKRSGATSPEAMDSPSPQEDSMMRWSFLPPTGSDVNKIPELLASTICCTTTAIPACSWGTPACSRYEMALAFQ